MLVFLYSVLSFILQLTFGVSLHFVIMLLNSHHSASHSWNSENECISCIILNFSGKARCTAWKVCIVSSSSQCYWSTASWSCYRCCDRGCCCTMVSSLPWTFVLIIYNWSCTVFHFSKLIMSFKRSSSWLRIG